MAAPHIPVMLPDVLAAAQLRPGVRVVDATFGAGGYTRAFLEAGAEVIAFDRDPTAIANGEALVREAAGKLTLIPEPFDQIEAALSARGLGPVDAVVFDFGVSSMQLDQSERGFSFQTDGPLDMRMGPGPSAADMLASLDEADLANVIYQYGEERRSRAIARAVVADRDETPFTRTPDLAGLCERVVGKGEKIHPATRTFQAIRIFVNDELGQIVRALIAAERVLAEGGRLACVSFHSLEDRLVKRFLSLASGKGQAGSRHMPVASGPEASFAAKNSAIAAAQEEAKANPRARSAKLRVGVRTDAPAQEWPDDRLAALGLPPLVFSSLQRDWSASS